MYVIVDGYGDHDPWEILFFPTHNNTKVCNSKGVKRITFPLLVTLGPNEQPIKRKITDSKHNQSKIHVHAHVQRWNVNEVLYSIVNLNFLGEFG